MRQASRVKRSIPNKIARSIRLAMAATTILGASHPAFAQQEVEKLPRVEITGSSIKRIDAETALPVEVITREAIERSGATTVEQLLSQLSASIGAIDT